jgi:hypothetical protein
MAPSSSMSRSSAGLAVMTLVRKYAWEPLVFWMAIDILIGQFRG